MQNIFTHWESVINFTRNDIVFERHNKEYGAYAIRRYYPERLRNAFLIATSGMILLFAIPLTLQKLSPNKPDIIKTLKGVIVEPVNYPPVKPDPGISPPKPPTKQIIASAVKYKITDTLDNNNDSDKPQEPTQNIGPINTTDNTSTDTSADTGPIDIGTTVTPPKPFLFAQEMPQFTGGESALDKFLKNSLKYPSIPRQQGISGRVYVTFIVGMDGKVKNAVIARGVLGGELLEEEALRVVRIMPDWKPGRNNGHAVDVQMTIPINFVLMKN